jgi:hypothetical protein
MDEILSRLAELVRKMETDFDARTDIARLIVILQDLDYEMEQLQDNPPPAEMGITVTIDGTKIRFATLQNFLDFTGDMSNGN